ncbi:MAG: hypothetical protein QM728_08615 [Gordonia sp. (in: high G+C Gram-positive bacteria)]|uniref:biotin synthase auxiliary protein BsaP n=1 Tax=Gordonia sp. (in: high G+C Gram-positive bacteria) TaxID=84139 RepID=UPI0039E51529
MPADTAPPAASAGPLTTPHRYGVYTGIETELQAADAIPTTARLGLEPPRYCGQCGRRMVVQVRPDGWWARCSRHGEVDSTELERR